MLTVHFNFKQLFILLAIASFLLSSSLLFSSKAFAAAGINRTINFQGRLVRNDAGNVGLNVANGTYSITFSLYNNPTAGAPGSGSLWSETQSSVTVTDGIFRVALGSATPIPSNFNFNWDGLYLGIKVSPDSGEMTPRIQMSAVPFAFNAGQVDGLTVQDSTSGAASTSATLKIGNATTPSTFDLGANSLQFITSTTTSLTLPTGGTLLTNTASGNQTITSTQTSGNALSIADTSGTGTLAGLSFNLSGSGTTYDLLGTGSSWSITKTGALSVASCSGCGVGGGGGGPSNWQELTGATSLINAQSDLLIGGITTASADFAFTGLMGNQTQASFSGNLVVMPNNGWGGNASISGNLTLGVLGPSSIQTTNNQLLTIGGNTTGGIQFKPGNSASSLYLAPGGSMGLGTTAPDSQFQILAQDSSTNSITNVFTLAHMISSSGFNPNTAGTLTTGLAAYWKMDESSGASVSDSAGSSNGTATGTTIVTGKINNARTLGTSDKIQTPYVQTSISAFSISIWIKTTAGTGEIFSDRGSQRGITLGIGPAPGGGGSSGQPFIGADGGTLFLGVGSSVAINDNNWHHIVGTWAGGGAISASQFKIYIDGTDRTAAVSQAGSQSAPITGDAGGAIIGANGQMSLSASATLDELGIWTKALSQQEVTDLYNSNAGDTYSNGAVAAGIGSSLTFEAQNSGALTKASAGIAGILTTVANGVENGALLFQTVTNGGILTEKARIDSNGNLAIGTTTPLATLDIRGNPINGGTMSIASFSGQTSFAALVANNNGIGDLFTASASGVTRFVVQNNGNVGIGTATPGAKLDVMGSATLGGSLTFKSTFGQIQTTADQTLTLGGGTTGNISFIPFGTPTLTLFPNLASFIGTNPVITATGTNTLNLNTNSTGNIQFFGSASNYVNSTGNLYLSGTTGITLSGNAAGIVFSGTGKSVISTAAGQSFAINPGAGGLIGINTAALTLLSSLDIRQNIVNGGTISVASVSGNTSFAALTVDNSGVGALFTASVAGATRFTITSAGGIVLGTNIGTGSTCLLGGVTASWGSCSGVASINWWEELAGAVLPANPGDDLLIGGFSTASADFAFTGLKGTQTQASMSGNLILMPNNGYGGQLGIGTTSPTAALDVVGNIALNANGTIDTRASGSLTIAGTNATTLTLGRTGQSIVLPGYAGSNAVLWSNGGVLSAATTTTTGQCLVSSGGGNPAWSGCAANPGGLGNYWTLDNVNATLYPINTTLDFLWGGTGTAAASFRLLGNTGFAGTTAVASISAHTSYAALVIDNTNGDFLTASNSGVTKFVVRQNGSVGIGGSLANSGYKLDVLGSARISGNSTSDDIVKATTSDFSQTNSVALNTTVSNGVSLTAGNVAGAAAPAAGPSTIVPISSGSAVFRAQNGKATILTGVNAGSARIITYDPATSSFQMGPNITQTGFASGSAVFQRQDGKYMVFFGNSSDVYDPAGSNNFGSMAIGPGLPPGANVAPGTRVIPRSDGKFLILLGQSAQTYLYDPTVNIVSLGPNLVGGLLASGSAVLQRPDGKFLIVLGNGGLTNIYDERQGNGGVIYAGPGLAGGPASTGANAFQMPDGRFMIILGGGSTSTSVYDPIANTFIAGPNLNDPAGTGSNAFQRPDGKWAVVVGGGNAAVNLWDPTAGAQGGFTRPANYLLTAPAGVGALSFQRDDGNYMVLSGGTAVANQTASTVFDVGWRTSGSWTSEPLASTKISTFSALFWDSFPQGPTGTGSASVQMFVKTAATSSIYLTCTNALPITVYVPVQNSGDLIQTGFGANCAQVQAVFNSPVGTPDVPQITGGGNLSGMWAAEGGTEYTRQVIQPALYDFKIQNPIYGYGGILSSDASESRSGATQSASLNGIVTTDNNSLTLAPYSLNNNDATASAGIVIASASADLGATAAVGAHTLQLPNGRFLVITGSTNITRMYDPNTGLFTAGPTLCGSATTGSFSIQLPDGRFMTFLGGGYGTCIYDPISNTFASGPNLSSNAILGAGAHAIQRSDGKFLVFRGNNTATTDIFDPWSMAFTPGPAEVAPVTAGAFSIKRPDGRYLTFTGTITTTSLYEESSNSFVLGTVTAGNIAAGAQAIQMANGNFIFLRGGATAIQTYDARIGTFTTLTSVLAGNPGSGSFSIPLPDGKILVSTGTNTTTIIDPIDSVAAAGSNLGGAWAGPILPFTPAAGTHVFQRPDGKFVVISGANTAIIDAGYTMQGTYITEPINTPSLTSNTSLTWKNTGQGSLAVASRTSTSLIGLETANWNVVQKSNALINPGPTDNWAQFKFTFQGYMPNMPYEKQNVWAAGDAGGLAVYYRQLQSPVLQDWRLLNTTDPNLLTLTSNGLNAFRFGADGQAYTAAGGAWNSGGADLAENYTSSQNLEAGDVVVGDKSTSQNVIQSTIPYQNNIMGVVSTQPGFVAGAYTPDSFPIALVGRVPVKVSTENGPIHSGDYLTSASIPGYAMKATVAGRVLGTAIQDFDPTDPTQVQACPGEGAGSLATTQCGTITVFVNLTSYNGENVELAMADDNFVASSSGLSQAELDTGLTSYIKQISVGDQNTLAYLESLNSASFESSEIFTGKVAAGEVISPNIVADLITAKTIKADHIEGLEILTNQLSALTNSMAVLSDATQSGEFATGSAQLPTTLNLNSLNVNGLATVSGDLNVGGNSLIQGALNVLNNITTNNLLVSQFAYFINDVVFKGNVRFNSTPTFNSDTAGFAVVQQGLDSVQVTFGQEYVSTPVVTASIALSKTGDSVSQKALEDEILNGNISYVITQRTTKGFIIRLNKPAPEDISFSWVALSVQNAQTAGLDLTVTPAPATGSAAFQSILNELNSVAPTPSQ